MPALTIADYLKFANLQMAAEALHRKPWSVPKCSMGLLGAIRNRGLSPIGWSPIGCPIGFFGARNSIERILSNLARFTGLLWVLPPLFFASSSLSAVDDEPKTLCREFGNHLNERTRLSLFAVDGTKTEDGKESIPNIDIDADGIDDQVISFCPGSASIIPADPCTLSVTLSSSRKSFTFEEQRFYFIRYKSNPYLVAGWLADERGPVHTDIYRLSKKGIKRLCSYDCRQIGGCRIRSNASTKSATKKGGN